MESNFTPITSTAIDSRLLKNCIAGNRISQKMLYDLLSPKMYAVCLRYAKRSDDAEDVLQEGFIKLFNHLHKYRGEGSFEGWARRIFVNTSIQHYRNQKPTSIDVTDYEEFIPCSSPSALDTLFEKDLTKASNALSNGYKTVFNLYAKEGYSHKEISGLLGITENTSKSQYLRAKASLREMIGKRA